MIMIMIMMVMMFRVMLSMICAMISDVYLFVISFLLSHSGTHVAIAHAMSVRSIAFSDDSQWILSGSDDGTCCIHDVYAKWEREREVLQTGIWFALW